MFLLAATVKGKTGVANRGAFGWGGSEIGVGPATALPAASRFYYATCAQPLGDAARGLPPVDRAKGTPPQTD